MTSRALPVPLPGPGVCEVCRASSTTYARCYSCNQMLRALDLGTTYPVPTVLPLGLAVKKSTLALALWNYKRSTNDTERSLAEGELTSLIDARLPHVLSHVGEIDTVTFVPSRKSRTNPVESLLEGTEWGSDAWIEDTLEVLDTETDTHEPDSDRFVARDVSHEHVLLIDDTFTRGATSMSAARALYDAGATEVTIVVLGRHTDLEWSPDEYLAAARRRAESGEFCPECRAEIATSPTEWLDTDEWEPSEPPTDDWEPPDVDPWESSVDPWSQPPADPWAIPVNRPSGQTTKPPSTPSHGSRGSASRAQPTAPVVLPSTTSAGPGGGSGSTTDGSGSWRSDESDEPSRLAESTALTMTAILAAPFALVVILPILLSSIGISLNPLDRVGKVWGPAGFNGYVTFMVFALSAGGVNWLLKSIHRVAAVGTFLVALVGVATLFVAPLVANSTQSTTSSSGPTNTREFRDLVNDRAPDRAVEAITLGEAQNAIDSVCPAVADGLTISEARSQLESFREQEGIPRDVADQILLMTEAVIEFSDSVC